MSAPDFPAWLHLLSVVSLALAFACAGLIVIDEMKRPQRMWIMNLVWPLTALFGSVLWLALYWRWGRSEGDGRKTPMAVAVTKGASHCGAGCTLGDIIAEWIAFGFPAIAVALGWKTLFSQKTFAVWVLDYIVAFALGIAFQYFTIKPMRNLSVKDGLLAAVKADAASITSWQVGMYAAMALIQFPWFERRYGGVAEPNTPEFWFGMQIAMICGFLTAYPMNWILVQTGVKERM